MNLLVKKFGPLAVVLLSSILIISCEKPGEIGLEINEENGVISTHYYETVLPTSVVQFDPRKTRGSYSIQAGEYFNNDFGQITSKSYSWLSLQPEITVESDAEFVSFEMEIAFSGVEGEELQSNYKQIIDIYKLDEFLDPSIDYTRVDELAMEASPLATWDFIPMVNDTLQTDSTYTLTLDYDVGETLFWLLKDQDNNTVFDSDTTFNEYFKGVAFVPTTVNYNIIHINRDRVVFRLNYNEFNSDGTPVKREYEMRLSPIGFHHIHSDLTGTSLAGLTPDNSFFFPADDYRYMQFGTMIGIHGDLTPFLDLTDTLKDRHMIINKAIVSFGGVTEYNSDLKNPQFIQTYFTDELNTWPVVDETGRLDTALAGQNFIMLQNEEQVTTPGYYRFPQNSKIETDTATDLSTYKVNLTFFLQNYYRDKFYSETEPFLEEKLQVLFFGESSVLYPEMSPSHVLTSPMSLPKDSIRLKIYYTIPEIQE